MTSVCWTQRCSLPFPDWRNKSLCLGHQISLQYHSVCPTSGRHCPGWHPHHKSCYVSWESLQRPIYIEQQMSVILTRVAKHRCIPMPGVVGHHVLGSFILKSGQFNLYPEALSYPPWSATLLIYTHLIWMLQTLFTLSTQTVSSQRGWASNRVPRNPWGPLPSMPSLTLAPITSKCFINWLCSQYQHFVLVPHWRHPPSPTSTLQHHRLQLESWKALSFPMVILAYWSLFSSLPWPWW